jgi:hypothetical protein
LAVVSISSRIDGVAGQKLELVSPDAFCRKLVVQFFPKIGDDRLRILLPLLRTVNNASIDFVFFINERDWQVCDKAGFSAASGGVPIAGSRVLRGQPRVFVGVDAPQVCQYGIIG